MKKITYKASKKNCGFFVMVFSKQILLLIIVCISFLSVFSQDVIYWSNTAPNGEWEWGNCCDANCGGNWYWSTSGTGNRKRPDCSQSYNTIYFDNANQPVMNLNSLDDYSANQILFNAGTPSRTINTNVGRSIYCGQNNGNAKIENHVLSTTHVFNVNINVQPNTFMEINPVNGNLTFNNIIANNSLNSINIYGSQTATFSGNISGTAGLTINSGAKVVYSGSAKTYTGATTILSGASLQISSDQSLSALSVNTGGTLIVDAGKTLTITGAFTGGGTVINNGTIKLAGIMAQTFPGSTSTINSMANLTISNPAGVTLNNSLTISSTLLINSGILSGTSPIYTSSSTLIYNTVGSYTTGIEWNAGGAGTLSAGVGIPQNVTIQSGTVTVPSSGGAATDRALAGNLTINSASIFQFTSGSNKDLYIRGSWTNNGTFNANGRKVTFSGSTGTQLVSGSTIFYDLALSNAGASTDFGSSVVTIGNELRITAGTMNGNISTFVFAGGACTLEGVGAKRFYNLQIDAGAAVSDLTASAGNIEVANSFTNNGTFTQYNTHVISFNKSGAIETLSGNGLTTFGKITVGGANLSFPTTLNAGSHNFAVTGGAFNLTVSSIFNGNTGTVTFSTNTADVSGTGTANFYNVITSVALNPGTNPTISKINNNLTINTGGSISTNSPVYKSTATLIYNTAANPYIIGLEWTGTGTIAGAGTPQNVTIQNTNTLILPGSRGLGGNLTIASIATLDAGIYIITTAGGTTNINGRINTANLNGLSGAVATTLNNFNTVTLGSSSTVEYNAVSDTQTVSSLQYGNLSLINGANKIMAGTPTIKSNFTVAGGAVTAPVLIFFSGGSQNIAGLAYNDIAFYGSGTKQFTGNTSIATRLLIANSGITVDADGASNNLVFTLRSAATSTAYVASIPNGSSVNGNVVVERYLPVDSSGTRTGRAWRLLTTPVTNSFTINQCWQQEMVSNNATNYITGTLIPATPEPGYGTRITGQQQITFNNAASHGYDFWDAISNSSESIRHWKQGVDSGNWVNLEYDNNNYSIDSNTLNKKINSEQGFLVYVRGDRYYYNQYAKGRPTTLRASGKLKQGLQSIPIIGSNTSNVTLIGNPYPSPVNFESVYVNNTNTIQNYFYRWNANLNLYGGYQLVLRNGFNSYTTTPLQQNLTEVQYIQSGQAFFVAPKTASGGLLTIQEVDKVTNTNNVVFLTHENETTLNQASDKEAGKATAFEGRLFINLNLLNSNDSTLLADGAMARFSKKYTRRIDANDISKSFNFYENLAIVRNNATLIVESQPVVSMQDTIFLKIWNTTQRSYQLQFKTANIFFPNVEAYLVDKYLNITFPVKLSGAATSYNFNITADAASQATDRFMVVFTIIEQQPPITTISTEAYKGKNDGEISVYPNPVTTGNVLIEINNVKKGNYIISLYSNTGQNLETKEIEHAGGNAVEMLFIKPDWANGKYIIEIKNTDNKIIKTVSLLINK